MTCEIEKILRAASAYPSPDNCQQFKFVNRESASIDVVLDEVRSNHPLNIGHANDWLTLGHLLEMVRIESSVLGIEAKFDFLGWRGPPQARILFERTQLAIDPQDLELHKRLALRTTDRRRYSKEVPSKVLAEVIQKFVTAPISFEIHSGVPDDFRKFALSLERPLWDWPEFGRTTLRWIAPASDVPPARGLNPRNLGTHWWESAGAPLIRASPRLYKLASLFGASRINETVLRRQLNATGWIGLYRAPNLSIETLVRLGQINLKIWTWLNGEGFGYQALSASTLASNFASSSSAFTAPLDPPLPEKVQDAFRERESAFSNLSDARDPVVWGFRSGGAAPLPPKMKTGRIAESST